MSDVGDGLSFWFQLDGGSDAYFSEAIVAMGCLFRYLRVDSSMSDVGNALRFWFQLDGGSDAYFSEAIVAMGCLFWYLERGIMCWEVLLLLLLLL